MTETEGFRPPLGLLAQTFAVLALVVVLVLSLVADGRLRILAVILAATSLLVGYLVLAVSHALETGRLLNHVVFVGILFVGMMAANLVFEATRTFPVAVTGALGVGAWLAILWLGNRLVYHGPLDTLLGRIRRATRSAL
jgi:hypothetical protein